MMRNLAGVLLAGLLFANSVQAIAQQRPPDLKTVPDSLNFIWKDIEHDFIALAEAMPGEKWNFKPAQGQFTKVRTFGEQVKHVACGNEGWAKQIAGEMPPQRCDNGGPNPAKTKSEILAYLCDSFAMMDKVIAATSGENLLQPNSGRYWAGASKRSAVAATSELSTIRVAMQWPGLDVIERIC